MLSESEQMRREADDTGPYAEFEHWRLLNARFNSVLEQIRSHDCSMAIQILHISKSKILKVPAAYLATQGRPQDFFQGRAIGGGSGQWLGGHHGECGARAYNWGLGAEPPAGSRDRAPG